MQGYTVFPGISTRALIGRRALNRGERLLCFPLNKLANDLVVPWKFTAFTKIAAIGKTLKEEITPFFDIMALGGGAYFGEGAYLKKYGIPKLEWKIDQQKVFRNDLFTKQDVLGYKKYRVFNGRK